VGTSLYHRHPLSWDLADWNWKQNQDTGQFYEQLFAADLTKAKRNGGKYAFTIRRLACRPTRIRGELAEKLGAGRPTRCAWRSSCARA
jgi:hypothetical protein